MSTRPPDDPQPSPPTLPTWDAPPPLPATPQEPRLERVPWRWWEGFVVFLLNAVSAFVVAGVVASGFEGDLGRALAVVAFEVTLALWSVAWVKVRYGLGPRSLGLASERPGKDAIAGLLWGLAGWVLSTLVVANIVIRLVDLFTTGPVESPDQLELADPSTGVLAITAVGVIVFAPLAEELFFRGFVYQAFRRRFALVPSAAISGALFMVAHAPFWIIFPTIFTLGVVLAWLFERRASLISTIVAHALFNTIGFLAYLTSL